MEEINSVDDESEASSNTISNDTRNCKTITRVKENHTANGETSEVEDLDISDTEDASMPDYGIPLSIDCNARVVTEEVQCDNDRDNYDMYFVDKKGMSHRGSEAGLHTSTEDLNVSDEEGQICASALQSVNLDGIASASSKKNASCLSTLNYSHTVYKDACNFKAEVLSDDEISCTMMKEKHNNEEKSGNHQCSHTPGYTFEEHHTSKNASSANFPTTQKPLSTFNPPNIFTTFLSDSNMHGLSGEQGSSSAACMEYLKSEFSGGFSIDGEDITFGSLDDLIESSKNRNPFGRSYNAFSLPETISEMTEGGFAYLGDSRRSSAAHTEDETFCLDNFCEHGKKRIKKCNFRLVDKNSKSEDSITDEEIIDDQ